MIDAVSCQIYKVWVLNENKNQTSANKYTNLQCII